MAWVKGQSGNPNGRPSTGETLTDLLKEYGNAKRRGSAVDRKRELSEKVWEIALSGDVTAIKYIYDRIDGRPKEKVEHSGTVEGSLVIVRPESDIDDD